MGKRKRLRERSQGNTDFSPACNPQALSEGSLSCVNVTPRGQNGAEGPGVGVGAPEPGSSDSAGGHFPAPRRPSRR